jgi:NAD(P)H-dependent FMN reductase
MGATGFIVIGLMTTGAGAFGACVRSPAGSGFALGAFGTSDFGASTIGGATGVIVIGVIVAIATGFGASTFPASGIIAMSFAIAGGRTFGASTFGGSPFAAAGGGAELARDVGRGTGGRLLLGWLIAKIDLAIAVPPAIAAVAGEKRGSSRRWRRRGGRQRREPWIHTAVACCHGASGAAASFRRSSNTKRSRSVAMASILGISGALRKGSFNASLLRAAVEAAPAGTTIETASIRDIPLYDGDVEASGIPASVSALKEKIAGADGVLLVTPEYNNSIPGVFKNAIDWTTRPAADLARIWGGRPVAVIGATPGVGGTSLAQVAWLQVLRQLGTEPWFGGRLVVPGAGKVFDPDGKLTDATVRERLEKFLAGFAEFVARHRR